MKKFAIRRKKDGRFLSPLYSTVSNARGAARWSDRELAELRIDADRLDGFEVVEIDVEENPTPESFKGDD